MSSRYEKHTPVIQLDEITSIEEDLLAELAALANSGAGEVIRKEAGHFVNSTVSEVFTFSSLSDVLITGAAHGDLIYFNGTNWVNLPAGPSVYILQTQGVGSAPVWNSVGLGTVTSVSVVTANGVSATVDTPTTTPSLTFTLGAITPSSVVTGALTATGATTLAVALTGVLRADAGLVSVDTDVTDLVTAASEGAAGKVELATAAEVNTGTDNTRAVSPDSLSQSVMGGKYATFMLFESSTSVSTGDGIAAFSVPADFNGMNLVAALATVHTKGITNTTDIQIRRRRAGVAADMLSTKITIGD